MRKLKTATQVSKMLLQPFCFEGMHAVDCTVGNGHDTLFLAQNSGRTGVVYGFDIQQSALDATKKRIEQSADTLAKVELYLKGHEHLEETVRTPVDMILYNLGYLPRHDKSITTMTETTLQSVKQALKIIKPGGVISIIAYPGHEEGSNERIRLEEFLQSLEQIEFDVMKTEFINQSNCPPVLFLIEKRVQRE